MGKHTILRSHPLTIWTHVQSSLGQRNNISANFLALCPIKLSKAKVFNKRSRLNIPSGSFGKQNHRSYSTICNSFSSHSNSFFWTATEKNFLLHQKVGWVFRANPREIHTSSASLPPFSVSQKDGFLDFTIDSGDTLHIPFIWLRDHCRSERFYNHVTSQKNLDPALLERDLTPDFVEPPENAVGILKIGWKDGHISEFPYTWLVENFYRGRFSRKVEKALWDAKAMSSLPIVQFKDHMNSESGLRQTLANLAQFGFSIVDGSPVSESGTQSVVERVCFVKQTLFGGMWTFTADGSRSDTAYSTIALGPHTDMTYMDNPAGIQVFHCLEHTGTGGETLLVDGFHALDLLRHSNQTAFDLLCRMVVPHEYIEPAGPNSCGYHLYSLGTVATVHPASGEIMHLRYNPYDRAPLNTVDPRAIPDFYKAYDQLKCIIEDDKNHLWFKLKPGMVILIDNWRVMHGRASFNGRRVMSGCYLGREEWVSRARMLGAL